MLRYASRGDYINLRISFHLYPETFNLLRDEDGNTLLHLACASPNVDAAVFCVLQNEHHMEYRNNEGRTPLLMAAAHGRDQTVEMLLDWGANILANDQNQQSAFTLAVLFCKPETFQLLQTRLTNMI